MKTIHRLLALVALVILAGGAYTIFVAVRGSERQPPTPQPAERRPARELRLAPGSPQLAYVQIAAVLALPEPLLEPLNARVAYDENYTSRVSSPIAGRVVRIGAQPGDTVRAGQPLAWLDSPEYGSAVADVAKAQTDLRQKRLAFERARSLLEGEVLARKDFESAQADLLLSEAELKRARARLANLTQGRGEEGERFELRAPISGVVSERQVNPGTEVRPDAASPLFVITDPTHLWVIIDLPERYLGKLWVGQKVLIEVDAYPGGDFPGQVASIGEVLDPATRRVQVRCTADNPGRRLKPEMYARVTPIADEVTKLPKISNSALVTEGLYSYVFVEKGPGAYEKRRVTLGLQGREDSYVKEGLAEGERVVTAGALLLNAELAGKD